jgi:SAM-dependent methyltransferase
MDPDAVRELYDVDTARTYNERWHGSNWGNDTEHTAEAIGRRVVDGIRWLDVGCGTGHFLSRFPGVDRAGTDLSPSMLAEARKASPDALFFKEWDFRNDNPEWRDGFSLVTCTGQPWSYLDTVVETEKVIENLANWTAPGGTLLVLAKDQLDLSGVDLPYHINGEPGFPGTIYMKAVVWSMVDRSHEHIPEIGNKWHHNMVWPLIDHWVATLGLYFNTVIVESLPHDPPWMHTPRRMLVAKDKRAEGDTTPVNVIRTNVLVPYAATIAPTPSEVEPAPEAPAPEAPAPVAVEAPAPEAAPEAPAPEAPAPVAEEAPGGRPRLRDLPLSHLVHKFRPWKVSFWRSALGRAAESARG